MWLEIILFIFLVPVGVLGLRWLLHALMTLYVEAPLPVGFYTSISHGQIRERQAHIGVRLARGPGWAHLGWIAHPEHERYRVDQRSEDSWQPAVETRFGSFLVAPPGGTFRVWACPLDGSSERLLGEVQAVVDAASPPLRVPRIAGPWRLLFKPGQAGYYINDHTIYQDAAGRWRLVGITSRTAGDFNAERLFAVGVSEDFPPPGGMQEDVPTADFGDLAWAPHIIRVWDSTPPEIPRYHMFWSPHKLHQMTSDDGITWSNHQVTLSAPYHRFFRDPWVLQVAEDQWLLYTTAKGRYYSQIDIYQSFNLREWQYIRTALSSARGSERNSPFSSMESPAVLALDGRFYLALTYNNDSGVLPGLLLLFKRWLRRESYNDTLVFTSINPYDFGVYRGGRRSVNLVTRLTTHAPDFVRTSGGDWYITTAGWPWVSTLTAGEAAVAPLIWEDVPPGFTN
jgi:arabinan endo-1,5-alpha-L-arabinosidase